VGTGQAAIEKKEQRVDIPAIATRVDVPAPGKAAVTGGEPLNVKAAKPFEEVSPEVEKANTKGVRFEEAYTEADYMDELTEGGAAAEEREPNS